MRIIMFTRETDASDVVPAAAFLDPQVDCLPPVPASYVAVDSADVVMIDARGDLTRARALCQLLTGPMECPPVMLVLEEGGAAALQSDWGSADFVMPTAGPAELSARLRLLRAHVPPVESTNDALIEVGDLVIDVTAYTARLHGSILDLTYKEFELLKFLAANHGRVLTRETLLDEVWGEDYIGGSRTVDVHIRRLRAKLGTDHDHLIGTVRNVGYRLDAPQEQDS
ncbi:DNA-binding response regulator [Actinomyces sp. 2119]|uniref:DNA-binding response regulator n=1 Tax=Actinomyces lilanjuaniae TaxID=2321394 RepID=A0ABM6Z1X1_9ACTO|nr:MULTISPECIES: response regulator transcription factor [Actinomyces]AYD89195.1 DNA-binding response regulator [Actinomyces lilanjuaniae]RJF41944.1 DNA-binding response regulator [Actinomyces sp. 2119]